MLLILVTTKTIYIKIPIKVQGCLWVGSKTVICDQIVNIEDLFIQILAVIPLEIFFFSILA